MNNFKNLFLNNSKFNLNNSNYKYIQTKHSRHLVDPSPSPLGGVTVTSGGVLSMHSYYTFISENTK